METFLTIINILGMAVFFAILILVLVFLWAVIRLHLDLKKDEKEWREEDGYDGQHRTGSAGQADA